MVQDFVHQQYELKKIEPDEDPVLFLAGSICAWNPFDLYFVASILQKKHLFKQKKGYLGSRFIDIYIYIVACMCIYSYKYLFIERERGFFFVAQLSVSQHQRSKRHHEGNGQIKC